MHLVLTKAVRVALTFLCIGLLAAIESSSQSQSQNLINQDTLTGTLSSKEDTGSYRIHIAANEFVLIRSLQKEMDIDLALVDATGRVLVNMDMEEDTNRAEYLGWVAADAGDFTVRVTPGRKNETYGRYEVQVVERRPRAAEDDNRIKAQELVMEAQASLQKFQTQPSGRLVREAIAKYQQSIPLWQAAKDKNATARSLIIVGENSLLLGERPAARDSFQKALVLRRAPPIDRWGEAEALNNLAVVHDETGEKQQAIELHKLVRPIRRETGNVKGEITTLLNLSKSYVELDEIALAQAALEDTRVVLDEFRKKTNGVGDQHGESEYSSRYGLIYDRLGASDLAITWFQRALTIIRSIPDYSHKFLYIEAEATYLNNLGKAHSGKGRKDDKTRARDYYQQALKRCGDVCPTNKKADFLHNLASVSIALGEIQTARSSFEEVLKARGNDSFYEAYTRIGLGNLNYETKSWDAARQEFEKALSLSEKVGARQLIVAALEGRARVELASEKEDEAEKDIERGLVEVGQLAARIVHPDHRASYLANTQRLHDHKLELLMRRHKRDPKAGFAEAAFALSESARARGLLDLLQEGRVDIRREIDPILVQRQRATAELYSYKLDYITSLKVRRERLRAANAPPEILNKLEREISDEEQEAAVVSRDLDKVQDLIRTSNEQYRELTNPRSIGVKEVQAKILDSDTMLLEYRLGEEHTYLFAISNTSFEVHALPKRDTIKNAVSDLYLALVARSEKRKFEPEADRTRRIIAADKKFETLVPLVSDMLLGKVTALSEKKRLLIAADGVLQYLPFAALIKPHSSLKPRPAYLVRTHEIVSIPSASALRLIGTGDNLVAPNKELVVIGDPVYQSKKNPRNSSADKRGSSGNSTGTPEPRITGYELEPLEFAGQEAGAILNLVTENDRDDFLRERATKQAATSDGLIHYRLIHYVAHGRFDSERPSRSALIFSTFDKTGTPVKGGWSVTIAEVYNMKLNADLVTLSGCETALGLDVRGEGMIGLTRGFMYAGSKRVLSSLWVVNDKATRILMSRFYNRLLKEKKGTTTAEKRTTTTTAEALRSAQESMAHLPPYFWSGFVLHGRW